MSKYSTPEKEIIDFLIAQDKKGKDLNELWDKKSVFLATIIQEYMAHFRAILGSSHPKSSYKIGFRIAKHMTDYNDITIDTMKGLSSDAIRSKKAFKLFLSPEYKPPVHPYFMLTHLIYLAGYYGLFAKESPLTVTSRIDLAMMKLVEKAIRSICDLKKIGSTGDRTGKSTATIRAKKDDMKTLVLAVFDDLNKQRGKATPSMVTNKINAAFVDLSNKKDIKLSPRYKGLIKNGHEELIKNQFNTWRNKNKETGVTEVSSSTIRRHLKHSKRT